ncbi:MAG: diacylglycerol kinase family protein [Ginsengibacter sp.]
MSSPTTLKIIFILNEGSGPKNKISWRDEIEKYFKDLPHEIYFYKLQKSGNEKEIIQLIDKYNADRIVAVGGDGTINLVGKILIDKKLSMGILKAGSANGLATELNIPTAIDKALDVIVGNYTICMDAIKVNEDVSFHLADVGMNARLIKYFEESNLRGMWNYARMLMKVLFTKRLMQLTITTPEETKIINAYMVVIANASKYGSGAVINPNGNLCDGLFELVIVRQISFTEFVKLFWSYKSFNPKKVEILHTTKASLQLRRNNHFQVDGEYKGKLQTVHAEIIPKAVNVLLEKTEMHTINQSA